MQGSRPLEALIENHQVSPLDKILQHLAVGRQSPGDAVGLPEASQGLLRCGEEGSGAASRLVPSYSLLGEPIAARSLLSRHRTRPSPSCVLVPELEGERLGESLRG